MVDARVDLMGSSMVDQKVDCLVHLLVGCLAETVAPTVVQRENYLVEKRVGLTAAQTVD